MEILYLHIFGFGMYVVIVLPALRATTRGQVVLLCYNPGFIAAGQLPCWVFRALLPLLLQSISLPLLS